MNWIEIIAALGGYKVIELTINFFADKKKRKVNTVGIERENERKHIDWLENRLAQRDARIDSLSVEVRELQTEKQKVLQDKHQVELNHKEAELRRCNIRGCDKRRPPSNF